MRTRGIHAAARAALWGFLAGLGAMALAAAAVPSASGSLPHLERRGHATQLIVDGQRWLVLGAELRGTAASTLVNMEPIWPELVQLLWSAIIRSVSALDGAVPGVWQQDGLKRRARGGIRLS